MSSLNEWFIWEHFPQSSVYCSAPSLPLSPVSQSDAGTGFKKGVAVHAGKDRQSTTQPLQVQQVSVCTRHLLTPRCHVCRLQSSFACGALMYLRVLCGQMWRWVKGGWMMGGVFEAVGAQRHPNCCHLSVETWSLFSWASEGLWGSSCGPGWLQLSRAFVQRSTMGMDEALLCGPDLT